MIRNMVCFLTVCLFASVGFSQEFYPSTVSFSAPTAYESYPVQTYAAQSYPTQTYAAETYPTQTYALQSSPVQYSASNVTAQASTYNFSGVQTETYGGFQSSFSSGQGTHVIDPNFGYDGPGDMRTHLWNDHANDLRANGVSRAQLNSMSMATVQKWHNYFHGSQGRPQ